MTAADLLERWRLDLESWAIPSEILAATEESPWVLPRQVFARRAERQRSAPSGASFRQAWDALVPPGSVLDIGAGAGAASLPLAPRATEITALDSDSEMLRVLAGKADPLGPPVREICGRWPDVAGSVAPADVVTCHHVLYNVADLGPFVAELTSHARRLVVVEITARHPLTSLNPLWERMHGLRRPEVPTADDALAILEALGLAPSHLSYSRPRESEYETFEELIEVTRRRLCLPPSRADDVAVALVDLGVTPGRPVDLGSSGSDLVTIWWAGTAGAPDNGSSQPAL
jgi:SAM-dependent methyltransferase